MQQIPPIFCSPLNISDLTADMRAASIREGMILTIHSSLRSIGHIMGGAASVVQALLEAVGASGTLVFPTLTFKGSLTLFLRSDPLIDLRQAPITTGAIPRAAAVHPLAHRSIHPSHPVAAIGPDAGYCVSGFQSGQGPCGTESPFYKAAMKGGYILLIGVTNNNNTTLHCVEELAAPYMAIDEIFNVRMIDYEGNMRRFAVRGYPVGLPRQFDVINERLVEENIMTYHRIGNAEVRLINGRRLIEAVTTWLQEEPYLLSGPIH